MTQKIGLVLILFYAIAHIVSASDATKPKQVVWGTIEKIDLTSKKLTLKPEKKGDLLDFTFQDSVYVWTKGKTYKLEDLKPGDQVSVYYDSASNLVTKVFVKSP
jgi:Cu/Ag efflux protein CusF